MSYSAGLSPEQLALYRQQGLSDTEIEEVERFQAWFRSLQSRGLSGRDAGYDAPDTKEYTRLVELFDIRQGPAHAFDLTFEQGKVIATFRALESKERYISVSCDDLIEWLQAYRDHMAWGVSR